MEPTAQIATRGPGELPADAQDQMESCQDGANCPDSCQMPRTRWRAASRCQDRMESCQDGAKARCPGPDEANCQMPRRAARMKPTTRCRTNCQLKPPDTQDPYPVVGATDGHDTPPEKQDPESRDYRRGTEEER